MAPRLLAAALALPVVLVAAQAAQAAPIAQSQGGRPSSITRAAGAHTATIRSPEARNTKPRPAPPPPNVRERPSARQPPSLIGYWKFDEGTGTTAADSSGNGNTLALQGGAGWAPGLVGPSALAVTPEQDAASSGPILDTSNSFTVSAWVNLANTNGFQTIVSEDGSQVAAFYLQLRGDTHQFALTRLAYDSPAAFTTIATSTIVPQPGVWYLLTGVYNTTAQTISLYVDGQLQQTVAAAGAPWPASGPFAVGRGFYNGSPTDWVSGTVDDVRAYSGALPASQIKALAGTGSITVNTTQPGPALNPTQFGAFLEEINHSGDGGIYAELVRNRDLKESSSSPVYWSAVQDGGASANIALDSSQPLNSANPVSAAPVGEQPAGRRPGRRRQRRLLGHPGQTGHHLQPVVLRHGGRQLLRAAHRDPGEQQREGVGQHGDPGGDHQLGQIHRHADHAEEDPRDAHQPPGHRHQRPGQRRLRRPGSPSCRCSRPPTTTPRTGCAST